MQWSRVPNSCESRPSESMVGAGQRRETPATARTSTARFDLLPCLTLHGSSVILLFLVTFLFLRGVAGADAWSPPPDSRPVEVAVGVFLVNLSGVAERSETFNADLYLSVRWRDPRLAFAGTEPERFLEDAAVEKLEHMWWPQLEFVNTAAPQVTNRALEISPDGSVRYELGVTGEFRADLDLRRFPFDRQTLVVRIQSFIWTDDQMVFVPDQTRIGFNPESTFEGLSVTRVTTEVERRKLTGWTAAESYSELTAAIDVERRAAFYVWTVLTPVVLLFIVPFRDFSSRIAISLTALLACIATHFAMSFNLPQIPYLTVIDRAFVITYACIALGVLVSTLQAAMLHEQPERAERIDRLAGLGLPALFLLLIAVSVIWWKDRRDREPVRALAAAGTQRRGGRVAGRQRRACVRARGGRDTDAAAGRAERARRSR